MKPFLFLLVLVAMLFGPRVEAFSFSFGIGTNGVSFSVGPGSKPIAKVNLNEVFAEPELKSAPIPAALKLPRQDSIRIEKPTLSQKTPIQSFSTASHNSATEPDLGTLSNQDDSSDLLQPLSFGTDPEDLVLSSSFPHSEIIYDPFAYDGIPTTTGLLIEDDEPIDEKTKKFLETGIYDGGDPTIHLSPKEKELWETEVDTSDYHNIYPYNDPTNKEAQKIVRHWEVREERLNHGRKLSEQEHRDKMERLVKKFNEEQELISSGTTMGKMKMDEALGSAKDAAIGKTVAAAVGQVVGKTTMMLFEPVIHTVRIIDAYSDKKQAERAENIAIETGKSYTEALDQVKKEYEYGQSLIARAGEDDFAPY